MYTALRKSLNKENDKGFTLIELLVVIIIIGILAAIAIPIFLSQRKKAVEAGQKSDARSIATQMETFYTDAQSYPVAANLNFTAPNKVEFGTTVATVFTPSDSVVLSPNNLVTIFASAAPTAANGGFCVEVTNPNTDKTAVYDSKLGGLQNMSATAACDAAYGTAIFTTVPATP